MPQCKRCGSQYSFWTLYADGLCSFCREESNEKTLLERKRVERGVSLKSANELVLMGNKGDDAKKEEVEKARKKLRNLFFGLVCIIVILFTGIGIQDYNNRAKERAISTEKLLADLKSSDLNVRLKSIRILNRRDNPSVKQPEIVDWVVFSSLSLLDNNAEWTDRETAKKYYDAIYNFDKTLVTDSLIRHFYKPNIRLRTLFLAIKLGIPGSSEKLIAILMRDGDKSMAEDFLNSGSRELYEGGKRWANLHGFSIKTISGSHRVSWGQF